MFLKLVLAAVLFLSFLSMAPKGEGTTLQATTYYVATWGSDSNPGTLAQPWRTIQHAADTLLPGDSVFIRGGVYNEHVDVTRSGVVTGYITYEAYPGERPILDGTGVGWKYGFDLGDSGVSYLRLRGLTIRNFGGFGFVSWSQSDHIELSRLEVYNTDTAVRFFDNHQDLRISDSYLHDNSLIGMDCAPGPCNQVRISRVRAVNNGPTNETAADGFAFESGDDISVEASVAANNAGDGFDFKSDGTTISSSIAYGNDRNGIKLWGSNSSLINSISHDNGLAGLVLEAGGSYDVINNLVAHNSRVVRDYGMYAGVDSSASTPVTLTNNIFAFNGPAAEPTGVWFTDNVALNEDHNLYFSRDDCEIQADFTEGVCFTRAQIVNGHWFQESGQGEHDRAADPRFVSRSARDYHLQRGSPAIDSGTSVGAPAVDYEGSPRPQGAGYDMGPYEACIGRGRACFSGVLMANGNSSTAEAPYRLQDANGRVAALVKPGTVNLRPYLGLWIRVRGPFQMAPSDPRLPIVSARSVELAGHEWPGAIAPNRRR